MDKQTENNITLKTISDLLGYTYFIPSYQRGYRWQPQQVKDLLNDINEFAPSEDNEFYCLQPLVVQGIFSENIENLNIEELGDLKKFITQAKIRNEEDLLNEFKGFLYSALKNYSNLKYSVIDGQQRLTTIKLILTYLKEDTFKIEYETRVASKEFLDDIRILNNIANFYKNESIYTKNIDFYYIMNAFKEIDKWFNNKDNKDNKNIDKFKEKLLKKTRVIWYETAEENIIEVFERLNSGKIPLTNAELIKALFLKSSNFGEVNSNELRLYQQEIAMQWDEIEYTLQNDEFWYFLNKTVEAGEKYKDTRIDFIFDLICRNDSLKVGNDDIGDDNLKAYRYINKKFENNITKKEIEELWKQVRDIYLTLKEWYNDIELYHYIGFLLAKGDSILDIYKKVSEKTKEEFIGIIKDEIIKYLKTFYENYLDELLELDFNKDKDKCRNVLLLYNLLTIVNILKNQKNSKYKLSAFYKFPFHLYKKEKFDIEHIASQTPNDMSSIEDIEAHLKSISSLIQNGDKYELKDKISDFLGKLKKKNKEGFDALNKEIFMELKLTEESWEEKSWDKEKDSLKNLALLDYKTNRGYGNAIFPVKRNWIISKELGDECSIAFVPQCTKNVFQKFYTKNAGNLLAWAKDDADAYFNNMKEILKDFIGRE